MSEDRYITITAYARKYGVSRPTVYKWVAVGVVETYQVDDVLRVRDRIPQTRVSTGVNPSE